MKPAIFLAMLLGVNLLAAGLFYWDKRAAQRALPRVPESVLLFWCLVGGSIGGGWAMRRFRHKTSKMSFLWRYWAIVAAQVGIIAYELSKLSDVIG